MASKLITSLLSTEYPNVSDVSYEFNEQEMIFLQAQVSSGV